MVCFCKHTLISLQESLSKLSPQPAQAAGGASAPGAMQDPASLNPTAQTPALASAPIANPDAAALQALAAWLASCGLPAPPWTPDPAWRDLQLPKPVLAAPSVATLQAFAQLQVMATSMGMNLMVPAQATAFARLAATVNARLAALAQQIAPINPVPWTQLAATLTASDQANAALALGILPTPPPMAPPLSVWRPFLNALRPLLPTIAIANQLQLDLSANLAEQLAPMVRAMLQIQMPVMTATMPLMNSITATMAALAQLQAKLGIDPLAAGLPQVREMVAAQASATVSKIEQSTGQPIAPMVAALPRIEYCPTLMAPPAVVAAAISMNPQPLAWQVPPMSSLPVLNTGLPVAAFASHLQAALNLMPSRLPCTGCDAQSLLTNTGQT